MAQENYFEYEDTIKSSSYPEGDYIELDLMVPNEEDFKKEQNARVKVSYKEVLSLVGSSKEENLPRDKANQQAQQLGDFALAISRLASEHTAYTQGSHFETNPFNEDPPYEMDSANFVYWGLEMFGLMIETDRVNIRAIKMNRDKLREVANIGSGITIDELIYGDILFFGSADTQVGIYVGDGEFVSFLGSGQRNYAKGATKQNLEKGIWKKEFKGHVMRIKD